MRTRRCTWRRSRRLPVVGSKPKLITYFVSTRVFNQSLELFVSDLWDSSTRLVV